MASSDSSCQPPQGPSYLDDVRIVKPCAGQRVPLLEIAASAAKLDFAANPNHYRAVSEGSGVEADSVREESIGHRGCCWSATPANCWIRTSANKVKEIDSAVPIEIMEGHDFPVVPI